VKKAKGFYIVACEIEDMQEMKKYWVEGDKLYVNSFFQTVHRCKNVKIKYHSSTGVYEITPFKTGAFVITREDIRTFAFVWSGSKWLTE